MYKYKDSVRIYPERMSENVKREYDLPAGLLVHVGCGPITPAGWVNLDASWNLMAARVPGLRRVLVGAGLISAESAEQAWSKNVRYCDVTRGLPFPDGGAAVVYASHVVEHLTQAQARRLMREAYRILAPRGVIRLVVPDLEFLARNYLAHKENRTHGAASAADEFMQNLRTTPDYSQNSFVLKMYRAYLDTLSHKWMYDAASLTALMADAGFSELEPRGYLDSRISKIQDVERENRFEDGICVEGVR